MRSAQLPSKLSSAAGSCKHWVVSVPNSSESYRCFCSLIDRALQPGTCHPYSVRFRLEHLLPADWSLLLGWCRRLTSCGGSFTYTSPGDISEQTESVGAVDDSEGHPAVVNAAFMHVVERCHGDFVPNNMIYHELQRRYTVYAPASPPPPEGPEDFTSFLGALQDSVCDGCLASLSEGDGNVGEDPLASQVPSLEATKHNQKVLGVGAAASVESEAHRQQGELLFNFFPHRVVVSDGIPCHSTHFVVMVNLKPVVPWHLMVVPIRCVGTLSALSAAEMEDLGHMIHLTISVLSHVLVKPAVTGTGDTSSNGGSRVERGCSPHSIGSPVPASVVGGGGFSIAIQQGELAGQTVPHLHVHVIPFDPRGKLAGEPEDEEQQRRQPPRTGAQMRKETEFLRPHFVRLANEKNMRGICATCG
ncbi:Bis(5'-adenosyl)-triphosphatase, putative [Trypanosoma equiperdum]|uniref:Bis(5'-adenosyl)-triphosphatase, putative n=1 Tax=Trypanosoma equiperdum TaxID=5694 RepID=A0A1G4I336_TRYEQ|nr:Bis(5'-adenosyl)-triphosphatase, putative [Trypanosoma equiperdum]